MHLPRRRFGGTGLHGVLKGIARGPCAAPTVGAPCHACGSPVPPQARRPHKPCRPAQPALRGLFHVHSAARTCRRPGRWTHRPVAARRGATPSPRPWHVNVQASASGQPMRGRSTAIRTQAVRPASQPGRTATSLPALPASRAGRRHHRADTAARCAQSLGLGPAAVIQILGGIGLTHAPVHLDRPRIPGWIGDAFLRALELPFLRRHDASDGAIFFFAHKNIAFTQIEGPCMPCMPCMPSARCRKKTVRAPRQPLGWPVGGLRGCIPGDVHTCKRLAPLRCASL